VSCCRVPHHAFRRLMHYFQLQRKMVSIQESCKHSCTNFIRHMRDHFFINLIKTFHEISIRSYALSISLGDRCFLLMISCMLFNFCREHHLSGTVHNLSLDLVQRHGSWAFSSQSRCLDKRETVRQQQLQAQIESYYAIFQQVFNCRRTIVNPLGCPY
jgi:hypothetical protein